MSSLGCTICLEAFSQKIKKSPIDNNEKLIVATKCGHLYHTVCLNNWFKKKGGGGQAWSVQSCPTCQTALTVATDVIRIFSNTVVDEQSAIPNIEQYNEYISKLKHNNAELQNRLEISFIQLRKIENESKFVKQKADEIEVKFKKEKYKFDKFQVHAVNLKKENDELRSLVVTQSKLLAASGIYSPPVPKSTSSAVIPVDITDPGPHIQPSAHNNPHIQFRFKSKPETRNNNNNNNLAPFPNQYQNQRNSVDISNNELDDNENVEEFMENLLLEDENKPLTDHTTQDQLRINQLHKNNLDNDNYQNAKMNHKDVNGRNFNSQANGDFCQDNSANSKKSNGYDSNVIESLFEQIQNRDSSNNENTSLPTSNSDDFIQSLLNSSAAENNMDNVTNSRGQNQNQNMPGTSKESTTSSENGSGYFVVSSKMNNHHHQAKEKYQGKRKIKPGQLHGKYLCTNCQSKWGSSNSFKNTPQTCLYCSTEVFPYSLDPIIDKSNAN